MPGQTTDGAGRGERNSLDLDALAVSDRFRLFNFTLPAPAKAEDQRDLLTRIDSALPAAGVVQELAWSVPPDTPDDPERAVVRAPVTPLGAPLVEHSSSAITAA